MSKLVNGSYNAIPVSSLCKDYAQPFRLGQS